MIYNQTEHILAHGSFIISDKLDSALIYIPGFERVAPSLIITPIGENANVNLFVDDAIRSYDKGIDYSLSKSFESKNANLKYSAESVGLQGWWRLNEDIVAEDDVTTDSSVNGRNGTTTTDDRPTTSALYPSAYIQKSSYTFDGLTDNVDIGTAETWNAIIGNDTDSGASTEQMSFAAWIYKTDDGGGSTGRIVDFATDIKIYTNNTERLYFGVKWNGDNSVYWKTGLNPFALNTWTHIAVTYDASEPSNVPTMYVNGEEEASSLSSGTPEGLFYGINGSDCHIGNSPTLARSFEGNLADVTVWNTVLSAENIRAIYDASIAGVVTQQGWPFVIKRSSNISPLTVQWQVIGADPTRVK